MGIHSDSDEPRTGTYLPFGDNLVGNLPEEDGVDKRTEPPSWLPEEARPSTGTSADLRTPEDGEARQAGTSDATDYSFGGDTAYQNGQDAMFAQQSPGAGYGYGDETPEEPATLAPPYPAQMTEAGAEPATTTTQPPLPAQDTLGSRDSANRTTTFSAPPRSRYLAGGAAAAGAVGGAVSPGPVPGAAPGPRPVPGSQVQARRADLVVARLEPWSVMKFSFLMSLVAWVVLFVAVAFLYFVLSSLGVFTSLQHTLGSVTSSSSSSGVNLQHWFSASRILGYTMLLGAVNIVLITALSTVGAMIYNLVTRMGGGIEVTLRESD